jgi:uncharacterized DUF497 family protein
MASSFDYRFEWDPRKAQANRKKHGVSFDVAAMVFEDPDQLSIHDGAHSDDEDRWITLGRNGGGILLVVVHTWRERSDDAATVRIISVRKATSRERAQYKASR